MIRSRSLLLLSLLVLLLVPATASAQGSTDLRQELANGWKFLEAGNLAKAEEAFKGAHAVSEGKETAEVYYAMSAVWWERKSALASYMWLSDATKARSAAMNWNGGPGGEWDQRIAARVEFLNRNFGAVRLRSPKRGKPMAPLADPPPNDPLLRAFADHLSTLIDEGAAEKIAVHWLLVPQGTYWVGDELRSVTPGEMDTAKADVWELAASTGKTKKDYDLRVAAIASGESVARAEVERLAQEADAEEARRVADAERQRQDAIAAGKAAEAERIAQAEIQRRAEANAAANRQRREQEAAAAAELERERQEQQAVADAANAERLRQEEAAAAQAAAEAEQRRLEEATAQASSDAERQAAERAAAAQAAAEAERKAKADAARLAAEKAESDRLAELERRRNEEESERQRAADEAAAAAARDAEAQQLVDGERRQQEQDEQRAAEKAERDALRAQRAADRQGGGAGAGAGPAEGEVGAFLARRLIFTLGGGGATVGRLTADGNTAGVDWTTSGELGYVAPLGDTGVGLAISLSYANLPVSGCSQAQTRGNAAALHVGPRIPVNLKGRTWLNIRPAFHAGALGTWPAKAVRDRCAAERLANPDEPIAYGVRLSDGDASARVSYADLGWRGYALVLGGDLDFGILTAPRNSKVYVGGGLYVRHDQVLAAIQDDTYRFRDEAGTGLALSSQDLSSIDGQASMARFQFGLRAMVQF